MKAIAVLPLAATLAITVATAAQAWTLPSAYDWDRAFVEHSNEQVATDEWHPVVSCTGLSTGMAHPACGTATGGPSGGLN